MKRIVFIADLHCGHRYGLTPPEWQLHTRDGYYGKVAAFEADLCEWYINAIQSVKPVDILVLLGDGIDGKGERSGGTEQITTDRNEQVLMAKKCIEYAGAKHVVVINGTPYHTGKEEDWEKVLSDMVGAELFANHEHIEVEGVKFDLRHKTVNTTVPYGQFTGPRKEAVWNALWAERGLMEHSDFLIRAHVHRYTLSEDDITSVITLPCLSGWTKYSSRECNGIISVGFLSFECENENAKLMKHFFDMRKYKVEYVRF
jgi:hypothetical protein